MHYYSDLKRIKKKDCMRTKIASMTCKSIAKWKTWWVLESATNEELWGALEKERGNSTPISLYGLVIWIKTLVMKCSSFTSVKNSFEIMAAKFVLYFEGEKD